MSNANQTADQFSRVQQDIILKYQQMIDNQANDLSVLIRLLKENQKGLNVIDQGNLYNNSHLGYTVTDFTGWNYNTPLTCRILPLKNAKRIRVNFQAALNTQDTSYNGLFSLMGFFSNSDIHNPQPFRRFAHLGQFTAVVWSQESVPPQLADGTLIFPDITFVQDPVTGDGTINGFEVDQNNGDPENNASYTNGGLANFFGEISCAGSDYLHVIFPILADSANNDGFADTNNLPNQDTYPTYQLLA